MDDVLTWDDYDDDGCGSFGATPADASTDADGGVDARDLDHCGRARSRVAALMLDAWTLILLLVVATVTAAGTVSGLI